MPGDALFELPAELRSAVVATVAPGERVVWARQPVARWFDRRAVGPFVFGVFWTVMCAPAIPLTFFDRHELFDGAMSLYGPTGWIGRIATVCCLQIGIACMLAPLWYRWRARRTAYVITDRRAITLVRQASGLAATQEFTAERVAQMQLATRRDGSGDLVFEVITTTNGSTTYTERRGFLAVADVRGVEELLRRTLLRGRTRDVELSRP